MGSLKTSSVLCDFKGIPWEDGETTHFTVKIFEKGTSTYKTVARMSYRLYASPNARDQETVEYSVVDNINMPDRPTEESKIILNKNTFRPFSSFIKVSSPTGNASVKCEYGRNKAKIQAKVNDRSKKLTLSIPQKVVDNYEFLPALRTLDFSRFVKDRIHIVHPLRGFVCEAEIVMRGKGQAEIGLGKFECYRIEADLLLPNLEQKQVFLISAEAPFHLIKNITGLQVIELTKC